MFINVANYQTTSRTLEKELIFGKATSPVTLAVNYLTSMFQLPYNYLTSFCTPLFQNNLFSDHFSVVAFISVYTIIIKSL